jgi:hypothetical protein
LVEDAVVEEEEDVEEDLVEAEVAEEEDSRPGKLEEFRHFREIKLLLTKINAKESYATTLFGSSHNKSIK